jgi:hypothetical protein
LTPIVFIFAVLSFLENKLRAELNITIVGGRLR